MACFFRHGRHILAVFDLHWGARLAEIEVQKVSFFADVLGELGDIGDAKCFACGGVWHHEVLKPTVILMGR